MKSITNTIDPIPKIQEFLESTDITKIKKIELRARRNDFRLIMVSYA